MKKLAILAFLTSAIMSGQVASLPAGQYILGMPSRVPANTGIPSTRYVCNVTFAGVLYIQTDAINGRLWVCNNSTGSYAWDHLITPVAVTTTATFPATSITGLSRQNQVITVAGAAPGMGCYAVLVSDPGSIQFNTSCYVTAANTVTVYLNNNSAVALTPTAVSVRFLIQ